MSNKQGKRSDPDYAQFNVYVHKAVRKQVRRQLALHDYAGDTSDLVNHLLVDWLKRERSKDNGGSNERYSQ